MEEKCASNKYCMTVRKQIDTENLKKGALDCNVWKTRCGRCYGPVARQNS